MLPIENYENYISPVLANANITIKWLPLKDIESRTPEGIKFMRLLNLLKILFINFLQGLKTPRFYLSIPMCYTKKISYHNFKLDIFEGLIQMKHSFAFKYLRGLNGFIKIWFHQAFLMESSFSEEKKSKNKYLNMSLKICQRQSYKMKLRKNNSNINSIIVPTSHRNIQKHGHSSK